MGPAGLAAGLASLAAAVYGVAPPAAVGKSDPVLPPAATRVIPPPPRFELLRPARPTPAQRVMPGLY